MSNREPLRPKLLLAAMTLGVVMLGAAADSFAQNECLGVKVMGSRGDVANNGTLYGAQNKPCIFQLQLPGAARTWSFRQRGRSDPPEGDRFAGAGSNAEVL
jgi:hypothetical protein